VSPRRPRARRLGLVVLAVAAMAAPRGARADGPALEITPFGGLFWSSRVKTGGGVLSSGATPDLGATLGFRLPPETGPGPERTGQIELLYAYAQPRTTLEPSSAAVPALQPFTLRYQYLLAGGLAGFPQEGYEPFASAAVGVVWISPSGVTLSDGSTVPVGDTWLFAASLGGGVKWVFSRALGLRVAARLYFPVFFSSATFLSGPGGAALTVSGGVPLVQGDLTVGLMIFP
jgi:hypothetical protein